MRSYSTLPEGYEQILEIDLQKNKKLSLWVNLLAIVIAVVMAVPAHFAVPISTLFSMEQGMIRYLIRFAVLMVLMVAYIILHELVHGAAMKLCGTQRVKYGFTGLYAFAGSDDYYGKRPYLFIALAPVVLWGVVLAIVNCFVPTEWFWVVYFIQIFNLSGAAGDLFVTVKFSRMPKDILIRDHGVGMRVFAKK